MADFVTSLPRPVRFRGTLEDFRFYVRNLLYCRRFGLPGCKRWAQGELDRLGVIIRAQRG